MNDLSEEKQKQQNRTFLQRTEDESVSHSYLIFPLVLVLFRLLSVVYSVALLMAFSAGWMTLYGLAARRHEGQQMHAALQMSAMQTILQMELNSISNQMEYANVEWHHLQQQAEGFIHQVQWEVEQAKQDAIRAQSYQKAAQKDQQKAHWMINQVNSTEHNRLALLQTIHDEEQAEKEMLQQLRDAEFSSDLCDTRGISYLCDLIGGVTNLQKDADETDLQRHRDMERLEELDQQEYLQIIAYQAFQHQADKYQRDADDLTHTASLWAEQANQDQIEADVLVKDAEVVEQQAVALEQQVRSYESSILELTNVTNEMLHDAHRYEKISVHDFGISLVLVLLPLVVFTFRCVTRLVLAIDYFGSNQHSTKDLTHGVGHIALHALFFLAMAVTCREYLAHLDQYSTRKRFIVICYVAFLGAVAQSFWLQAIPHTLFEQHWRTSQNVTGGTMWVIVQMFLMRLTLLLPFFFLEILFLWLSPLRQTVLHFSDRMLFFVYLSLMLGIVLYILYLEPRQVSVSIHSHRDDDFTISQDDSEDEEECAKESTPLKSADYNTTDTELFLEMLVAQRMDQNERDLSHSLNASSPFYVDFPNGLRQIFLFAEVFLLFCVLVILNLNIELLIPSYVRPIRITFCCLVAGVTLAWTLHARRHGSEALAKRTESEFSAKTIDL